MALLILALLQRIFLMSSLMLLLVWLIFFMVLIKLLDRKSGSAGMPRPISYAVFCLKKKKKTGHRPRRESTTVPMRVDDTARDLDREALAASSAHSDHDR